MASTTGSSDLSTTAADPSFACAECDQSLEIVSNERPMMTMFDLVEKFKAHRFELACDAELVDGFCPKCHENISWITGEGLQSQRRFLEANQHLFECPKRLALYASVNKSFAGLIDSALAE